MEVTLLQQLVTCEQVPLYSIFLDLRKAFSAMDRGRCLKILEDSGMGLKVFRLIRAFWEKSVLFCRASGYRGRPFSAKRGVTQSCPLSSIIFSIMMNDIIQESVCLIEATGINAANMHVIAAVCDTADGLVAV